MLWDEEKSVKSLAGSNRAAGQGRQDFFLFFVFGTDETHFVMAGFRVLAEKQHETLGEGH